MPNPYNHPAVELASQAQTFRMRIIGTSMAPFLKNGESVMIRAVPLKTLRIGDLVAFRRNGQIITHRLISMHETSVNTMGDNLYKIDPPISPSNILGKVISCQINDHQTTLIGGRWKIIHPMLAWLGWQAASPHRSGWVARFPRAVFWLSRRLSRILLYL